MTGAIQCRQRLGGMFAYNRLLYDVAREARERKLDGETRRAVREARSKPILKDIRAYLE